MVKNRSIDSERNQRIYNAYTTTDKTARQVADEFGLSESRIRHIVHELKINQTSEQPQVKKSKRDRKTDEYIDNLLKNNKSQTGPSTMSTDRPTFVDNFPEVQHGGRSNLRNELLKFKNELNKY